MGDVLVVCVGDDSVNLIRIDATGESRSAAHAVPIRKSIANTVVALLAKCAGSQENFNSMNIVGIGVVISDSHQLGVESDLKSHIDKAYKARVYTGVRRCQSDQAPNIATLLAKQIRRSAKT